MKKLVGWLGKAFAFFIQALPGFVQNFIGIVLGFIWFDVLRIRRQIVLDNIGKAFPELTMTERTKLGRRSLFNLGRGFVEYSQFPFLTKDRIDKSFRVEGRESMDKALAEGKGVFILTLHIGNGDLGCMALALMGWPMNVISKNFKMEWLNDLWFGLRKRLGVKIIPARDSIYSILKALKRNEVVAFPLDQFTGPPIGVKTRFFGFETGTAVGLALMSERSQAIVVPTYTYREKWGKHVLCFEEPIPWVKGEDRDQSLVDMTQRYNDCLEKIIRRHPDQWMWIHRRWKRHIVR